MPVCFTATAQKNINADEHELSLLERLKVYQLTELTNFQESTFQELWKMDQQVLKDSMLSVKEFTLSPSESLKLKIERQEKAKDIGVVAVFRHPE